MNEFKTRAPTHRLFDVGKKNRDIRTKKKLRTIEIWTEMWKNGVGHSYVQGSEIMAYIATLSDFFYRSFLNYPIDLS